MQRSASYVPTISRKRKEKQAALSEPLTEAYQAEDEEGPIETSPLRPPGRKRAKALTFLDTKKEK